MRGSVTFYARWVNPGEMYVVPSDDPGTTIDLGDETLTTDISIAAHSIDGGRRWRVGEPNIAKMLNNAKGTELRITDNFDRRGKRPAEGATTISFPKIMPRLKLGGKPRVNYALNADPTGASPGAWTLTNRGGAVVEGLETVPLNGRTRNGDWSAMPEEGIAVQPPGSPRQAYLVRIAPMAEGGSYRPASRPVRVTPRAQSNAPKYRIRNDVIKVRAGTYVGMGGETVLYSQAGNVNVADVTGTISLWMAPTANRPSSGVQELG
jgi:hypothetical protein